MQGEGLDEETNSNVPHQVGLSRLMCHRSAGTWMFGMRRSGLVGKGWGEMAARTSSSGNPAARDNWQRA